jgi:uncharacterized SAM-binding protein YcdF (DUF218 family)
MFYAISKIFWLFAAPSNLIALMIFIGALIWWWGRVRPGRWMLLTGAALYIVCASGPVGPLLTLALENRFSRPALDMPAPDGVIVLGGAMDETMIANRGALVLGPSGSRMTEAAALALRYPNAKMVFTGGSADILGNGSSMSEAQGARLLFTSLGLPPDRFVYEDRSRNTWENAIFTRDLVQPKAGERWLLVTSATHIPRAMGVFRQAGFDVVAWPAHYFTSGRLRDALSPARQASDGLMLVDIAAREWIGLVVYRLTGKSNALFPAP